MPKNNLEDKLDNLINILINTKVAPVAPVAPVLPLAPVNSSDHDLLQRIDTKVDRVILDVGNIDKNYSARIETLEKGTIDKVDYEAKHKLLTDSITELQSTKNSQTVLISIGIGLILILTSMLIYHIFGIRA